METPQMSTLPPNPNLINLPSILPSQLPVSSMHPAQLPGVPQLNTVTDLSNTGLQRTVKNPPQLAMNGGLPLGAPGAGIYGGLYGGINPWMLSGMPGMLPAPGLAM